MNKLSSEQWSQYWSQGLLTTFGDKFSHGYDGDIRKFWFKAFEKFDNEGIIADLGSGNGALIQLLSDYAVNSDRHYKCTGLDFANIEHLNKKKFPNLAVSIQSQTQIENSKFSSLSVKHIISQFGFEYSNFKESIVELNRICESKGTLSMILHSQNSKLILEAQQQKEQIEYCLSSGLIEISKNLIPLIEKIKAKTTQSENDHKEAEKLRLQVNQKMEELLIFAKKFSDQFYLNSFVNQLMSLFGVHNGQKLSLIEKVEALKAMESASKNYLNRLVDMYLAALTQDSILDLKSGLQQNNFINIEVGDFMHDNSYYGFWLRAEKQ